MKAQYEVNDSKISNKEKIAIVFLLIIIVVIIAFFSYKIIHGLSPKTVLPNNSLIISGYRNVNSLPIFGFRKMQYVFNIEKLKIIDFELPKDLGDTPEWSPDKKWIAFSNYENLDESTDYFNNIYIISADGSKKILVPIQYGGTEPTWSPDSKQIAFYRSGWGSGIYIIDVSCLLQGESCIPKTRYLVKQHGHTRISSPTWSPDGKQIAYVGVNNNISVINTDGTGLGYNLNPNYSGYISQIRWSPRGDYIVGVCTEKPFYSLITNLCLVDINGTRITYLNTGYGTKYPKWSPDGQKIAYILNTSNEPLSGSCWEGCPYPNSIFIINVDGTKNTRLTLQDNEFIQYFFWYP